LEPGFIQPADDELTSRAQPTDDDHASRVAPGKGYTGHGTASKGKGRGKKLDKNNREDSLLPDQDSQALFPPNPPSGDTRVFWDSEQKRSTDPGARPSAHRDSPSGHSTRNKGKGKGGKPKWARHSLQFKEPTEDLEASPWHKKPKHTHDAGFQHMDLDGEDFIELCEPDSAGALRALRFVEDAYGTDHPLTKDAHKELIRIQALEEAKAQDVPIHISMGKLALRLSNLDAKLAQQADLMHQAKD
jgi:hypothetical protein